MESPEPTPPEERDTHGPANVDPDAGRRRDAAWYAEAFGVSQSEAMRRLDLQVETEKFGEQLTEATQERFAGVWIENVGKFRVVLRVTGDEPLQPAALALAADAPVPVEIQFGAPLSLAEMQSRRESVVSQARSVYGSVASDIDIKTGTMELMLDPGTLTSDAALGLGTRWTEENGMPVVVRVLDEPGRDDHTYGGMQIGGCTTGFTVSNYSSVTGVLTNAHCTSPLNYTNILVPETYPTTFQGQSYGANADVQWRSSSHVDYPYFWDGLSTLRPVNQAIGRSSQVVGAARCHFGYGTGWSCGVLGSLNFQPSYGGACPGGPCQAVWATVSNSSGAYCDSGDSGGPWFYGNAAYGIHKGHQDGRCIYMCINYITNMWVFVLTTQ